jgi:DNA topoisomerase-1
VLGAHPAHRDRAQADGRTLRPYVTDGTTHASLPKDAKPEELTLEEAAQLIDERARQDDAQKGEESGAEEVAAKKPPAKKAPKKAKETV